VYGNSTQDVQAFVLTLNPTNLAINSVYYRDLGIQRGFGGRLFTNGMDVNGDGYTEFVLFGWANTPTGSTTGWQGGIGKIYTNKTDSTGVNTDAVGALDPSNWIYDLTTYSGVVALPVTSKVAAEQCFDTWYLYSGTGRYFFPQDNYTGASVNYLMGIPFTCDQYNRCGYCLNSTGLSNRQPCSSNSDCTSAPYDSSCSTSINIQNANACSALQNGNLNQAGWQYNLDAAAVDGSFLQERMITDPTMSPGDKVYLTTAEPTSDPCGYGGQSRVWGLNCATGAAITDQSCSGYTVTDPTGTLYLQTSTGAIYQINAASSFSNNPNSAATGNRSTQWFPGIPPENAPPLAQSSTAPPPGGQLMQWIER
jgi:type IV pilus assembly protein PilY1